MRKKPKKKYVKGAQTKPGNIRIPDEQFHQYLWDHHRGPRNVLKTVKGELAEEVGITQSSLSRKLASLVEKERLKKLRASKYVIVDPSIWAWTHPKEQTGFW